MFVVLLYALSLFSFPIPPPPPTTCDPSTGECIAYQYDPIWSPPPTSKTPSRKGSGI